MSASSREIKKLVEAVGVVDVVTCDGCGFEALGAPSAGRVDATEPDITSWLRVARCTSAGRYPVVGPLQDFCPACADEIAARIAALKARSGGE